MSTEKQPAPAGNQEKVQELPKNKFAKSGRLKLGTTLRGPRSCPKDYDNHEDSGTMMWGHFPASRINVRKKYYLSKAKEKAPSAPNIYEIQSVDAVKTKKNKLTHMASYFDTTELPRKPVGGKDHKIPEYITFTIIVHTEACGYNPFASKTDSASVQLLCVCRLSEASRKTIESGKLSESLTLWDNFIKNDFKGDRKTGNTLKMIAQFANENTDEFQNQIGILIRPMIKKYNGTPFLIFKAARYYWRSGMIDIEVDTHLFAGPAKKALDNFLGLAEHVVVDVSTVIEGRCDEHLPEQILTCGRVYRVAVDKVWELDEATQKKIQDLPDEIEPAEQKAEEAGAAE